MENNKPSQRLRKIHILPNLFTTANMFCGFFAIISAINSDFVPAAWSILIAILFDTMDGRIARLTRATSAFGVEYDSLSDLISFGIAPALVTYLWCLKPFGRLGWLAAFLYLVCAALRLARFNVFASSQPKSYFQGMPSPLAASTVATAVIFYSDAALPFSQDAFMLTVTFVLATLMISTVRFYSGKDFRFSKENSFEVLAVGILMLILLAVHPEVSLFVMCISYTFLSLVLDLFRVVFKRELISPLREKNARHS